MSSLNASTSTTSLEPIWNIIFNSSSIQPQFALSFNLQIFCNDLFSTFSTSILQKSKTVDFSTLTLSLKLLLETLKKKLSILSTVNTTIIPPSSQLPSLTSSKSKPQKKVKISFKKVSKPSSNFPKKNIISINLSNPSQDSDLLDLTVFNKNKEIEIELNESEIEIARNTLNEDSNLLENVNNSFQDDNYDNYDNFNDFNENEQINNSNSFSNLKLLNLSSRNKLKTKKTKKQNFEDKNILIPSRSIKRNLKNTNFNNKQIINNLNKNKMEEDFENGESFKELLKNGIEYIKRFNKATEMSLTQNIAENSENNLNEETREEYGLEDNFDFGDNENFEENIGERKFGRSSLFKEISGMNRREACGRFWEMLKEVNKGKIKVVQNEGYGDVEIYPVVK